MDPGEKQTPVCICNITTHDLRSIPIKPQHSPHHASWSDFVYAVGPVFWLFRQQIEGRSLEECKSEAVDFARIVWTRWLAIWPEDTLIERKKLIQDIKWESEFHRQYVRINAKQDVKPELWNEAIDPAIAASNFERWADSEYVLSLQPPPPPPPTPIPPSPYDGLSVEDAVNKFEQELDEYRKAHGFVEEKEDKEEDEDWILEWH
ncbi:hypothetical protein V5O48_018582 [Marasmius crinis-equi]|uniref:Uncharacterized protein n=1 Tax=Marasmius crinis-equi TaxID=585013 RepID=A0ABR3EKR8_9AGAR